MWILLKIVCVCYRAYVYPTCKNIITLWQKQSVWTFSLLTITTPSRAPNHHECQKPGTRAERAIERLTITKSSQLITHYIRDNPLVCVWRSRRRSIESWRASGLEVKLLTRAVYADTTSCWDLALPGPCPPWCSGISLAFVGWCCRVDLVCVCVTGLYV